MVGMHKLMGDEVCQNKEVTLQVAHRVMEELEE